MDAYIKVKVRYRPSKLDKIWVFDDAQEEWIEVLNSDPETRNLSEFQLSMIGRIQREAAADCDTLSIAEARNRMRELVAPLLAAKTQRARKRALKMLGWTTDLTVLDPATATADHVSSEVTTIKKPKTTKPKRIVKSPNGSSIGNIHAVPGATDPQVISTEDASANETAGSREWYSGDIPTFAGTAVGQST